MVKRQTKSVRHSKIIDSVIKDVSNGQFLHASFAKHGNIFGDFAVNLIKVGEEGGILDQNLEHLAEELKKRHELKKKIMGAMIYPAFITLATVGVTALITVYIFPKLMPIFNSLGANLPLTTRSLIWTSNFLIHYGILVVAGFIASSIGISIIYKKFLPFNLIANRVMLRVPIFGKLYQNYHMANLCRTFGLLLNCQVGIISAANITADATPNKLYKREIRQLSEDISKGRKISEYFDKRPDLFPEIVPQMVAIGETAGNLGETLLYLSNHYESETSDMTKNLSNSLEPVMLVGMGLIVGFVAVSVITPIYELTQNLHP
jgi:type IV pilus assembly protein PilC